MSEGHIVDVIKKPKGFPKMAIFGPNNSCTSTSFPKAQFREQKIMHGLRSQDIRECLKGKFLRNHVFDSLRVSVKIYEKGSKIGFSPPTVVCFPAFAKN